MQTSRPSIVHLVNAAFQRQTTLDALADTLTDLSPEQIRSALRSLQRRGEAEFVGARTWRPARRRFPRVALAGKDPR